MQHVKTPRENPRKATGALLVPKYTFGTLQHVVHTTVDATTAGATAAGATTAGATAAGTA